MQGMSLSHGPLSFNPSIVVFIFVSPRLTCSMLLPSWCANPSRVYQWTWPSLNWSFRVSERGTVRDIRWNNGGINVMWRSQRKANCSILVWWRKLFAFALCICMCNQTPPLFKRKKLLIIFHWCCVNESTKIIGLWWPREATLWHTSILAWSSALASGAGPALTERSRDRDFFVFSAWALLAALSLHDHADDVWYNWYVIHEKTPFSGKLN